MTAVTIVRNVAIALGVLVFAVTSAAARPFDVGRDASRVQRCFATYLALAEATNGATTEPQKTWSSQGAAGVQRAWPHVNLSARADPALFANAATAEQAIKKQLAGLPASSPGHDQLLAGLAQAAKQCDQTVAEWDIERPPAPAINPIDADPDALAGSLIDATRSICVPYVVDAAPIDKLVRGPGITKRVDNVHGVDVTRYIVEAPGHPRVTPSPAKDYGIGPDGRREGTSISCWIALDSSPDTARLVAQRFRERFALTGYETTLPHDVEMPGVLRDSNQSPPCCLCVHGKVAALVQVSGPFDGLFGGPPRGEVDVHVDSSRSVTVSEGCVTATPAEVAPTPEWNQTVCMGIRGFTPDQQIAACTDLISSKYDAGNAWVYYNNRGDGYAKKGQFHHAIEDFSQAIHLKSDDPNLYDNRGKVYYHEGRFDLAISDFEAAIRLKPNDEVAKSNLEKARSALAGTGRVQP